MSDVSEIKTKCSQEGCPYETDRVCLEGHGENCPFLTNLIESTLSPKEDGDILTQEENTDLYILPSNDEITNADVERITYKYSANLILLVGEPDSGKSTLFASLFDRFQKGAFMDYYFAGTKTPLGFERKCHHARVISLNKVSKTERTKTKEFTFLHLAVREKNLITEAKHLLFADVNGEKFQAARNEDDEMLSLKVFSNADHICFIVDGSHLVNPKLRQTAKNNLFKIIDRALQNGMISIEKGINIIITKMDMVGTKEEQDSLESFFVKPLDNKYGELIKNRIGVASRSKNVNIPAGFGINEFLRLSLERKGYSNNLKSQISMIAENDLREFQKFKYRKNL
ncbi:MAG: TRAFAC clade GTPase domain-containing protein [Bacteroidia bacterium]